VGRFAASSTVFGDVITSIALNATQHGKRSVWHLMDDIPNNWGWQIMGAIVGVSADFFEASLYGLIFGVDTLHLLAVLNPRAIPGGHEWWTTSAAWLYDERNQSRFYALLPGRDPCLCYSSAQFSVESATLLAATSLNVDQVEYPWSNDQMIWLDKAGYGAQRMHDWWSYFWKGFDGAVDVCTSPTVGPGLC
jgi:hypothetical protein